MRLSATRLAVLSSPFERRRSSAQSFNPVSVFGTDLVTWYGNSVDELWAEQSGGGTVTLYQDSAGITPVTAVEQFVGLVLDKSNGLELGPELVTNGTFDTNVSGWTADTGSSISWTSSGIRVQSSALNAGALQTISTVSGRWYQVSVRVVSGSFARLFFGSNAVSIPAGSNVTAMYAAESASTVIELCASEAGSDIVWDNISVRELPGHHLSQKTATARSRLIQRTDLPGSPFALRTDGTDDLLVTGTIDLAGVPGLHMIGTAVRTAGTARAVLTGFGDPITNTNGINLEFATDGLTADAGIRARSGGTAGIAATPAALLTPMVLPGWWDASDKLGRSRVNGGATQTAAGPSGDTGLGSGAVSVGARPDGTNGFAGDIFALPMIVKRLMTPSELAAAEKAFGKSIGVLQ